LGLLFRQDFFQACDGLGHIFSLHKGNYATSYFFPTFWLGWKWGNQQEITFSQVQPQKQNPPA